jgi:hypothetical protein
MQDSDLKGKHQSLSGSPDSHALPCTSNLPQPMVHTLRRWLPTFWIIVELLAASARLWGTEGSQSQTLGT